MNRDSLTKFLLFLILLLVQVLVLNHIHLFGYATPLLYVYLVLLFRRNYPRWAILLWSFAMGLCVDVFSNTPGLAAGSMTLLGLVQPYLLDLFIQHDSPDDMEPSMKMLGVAKFSYYTLLSVTLYCLVFFTLESFNFFNWPQWLACVVGSTLLTTVLVIVIENLRGR
ncbi:MAG: rod shape-determining protein MreD [Prevotella sp.]|nr:rod shape-determining protein MreD [Prevotella sp.]